MTSKKYGEPKWVGSTDKAIKGALGGLFAITDGFGEVADEVLFPKRSRTKNGRIVHIHYHGVPPRR